MARLLILLSCLTVAIPSTAAVTGTVMNADGRPVAGARVTAYALETVEARRVRHLSEPSDRKPLVSTETATSGKFSIELPKETAVAQLQILAAGYAPHSRRVERDGELAGVPLTTAEPKSGRVTAGGKPVAGAKVIVSGGEEVIVTTDLEGRYTVPDPSKWANTITVIHRDYAIAAETSPRTPSDPKMNLTLDTGVALSGRVVGRDGETPVAGAQIFVDGWRVATSGENGVFTIAHAPKNWQWVSAKTSALSARRARGGDLTIRLQPSMTFTGMVRDTKTAAPIVGAEVFVRPPARFDISGAMQSAFSDTKGNFTITDFVPGTYTLAATRPGYTFIATNTSVAAGDKSVRTVLGTRMARVSGMVIDEQNQPVGGARMTSNPMSGTQGVFGRFMFSERHPAMSAPDGTYAIDVPPESDQRIAANRKGFPPGQSATLRLSDGERKRGVMITIPAGIAITGRVTNGDDQPLAGVQVAASESRPSFGGMRFVFGGRQGGDDDFVQTAADGTFSITLKQGRYDLGFHRDGFATRVVRSVEVSDATTPLAVTLEPGVSVGGRVTRSGAGVAGVNIMLVGETVRESAETAADGTFVIPDLTPGPLMLMASKPDELIQHSQPVTAPARDLEIDIPPGGQITGRVIDKETKGPVTTFEAGISRTGGGRTVIMMAPHQKPFTADDGTFVLDNVPVGAHALIVNAAGYTTATIPSINVEEGKSTAEITVEMDRGARVSGRVTGSDGSALSGVAVRVSAESGRVMNRMPSMAPMAVTDASGEYAIEAVETGERTLSFDRTGYVPFQKTVDITGRQARVDAQLSNGVRVIGTVVTEGGAPIADAHVAARSASGTGSNWSGVRSDQNGTFEFEAMEPGRYTFHARKEGYPGTDLADFDITTGAPVRLVLKSGGTIYGRVTGLSAEEMAYAHVMASSTDGTGASAQPDASGSFRIEGAPTGTVRVFAMTRQPMGMARRQSAAKSVQVEVGSAVQADIAFNTDTVIQGRVTRDGRPVPNAFVSFSPRPGSARTNATTIADSSGYYEVPGLEAGTYNVSAADAQRRGSFNTTYEVSGSGTFDIDMRSSAVRGRVVDAETGAPIGGATVEVRPRDNSHFGRRVSLTDPSGVFIAESVTPGDYDVLAEMDGYGAKITELTVGDAPADIEVKLTPNPGVSIRVVDGRSGRVLNAFIRVLDSQNRVMYEPGMRWSGAATPDVTKIGLEPGNYRAVVSADGYATRDVAIASPGSHTIALTPGGTILIRSKGSELRRGRLVGADGRPYSRNIYSPTFMIDPDPGVVRLEHIAPGAYTLQIVGPREEVVESQQVIVGEAQTVAVEI